MRLGLGVPTVEGISVSYSPMARRLLVGDIASAERDVRAMTIESDDAGARIPLQRAAADEAHLRRSVERELHVQFPSVAVDQVAILVDCLWSHFDGAPVRDFVPLLVRKQAVEELLDHLGPRAAAMVLPRGSFAADEHANDRAVFVWP